MAMLKDEKLQKMMKDVMQNGQQSLQKYLSDPDAIVLLKNLGQIMGKLMNWFDHITTEYKLSTESSISLRASGRRG